MLGFSLLSPFTLVCRRYWPLWLCGWLLPACALADVRLPTFFADGAIVQRDQPIQLWGWADEGERVRVRFAGHEAVAQTQAGRWQVRLPALPAGGPYLLEVSGKNQLQRRDIYLGDLWLAAGQSNMEQPLRRMAYTYPEVLASTQLPLVREFYVPMAYGFSGPHDDYPHSQWRKATPEHIADISAVGFFFAQKLQQQLVGKPSAPIASASIASGSIASASVASVPIGIISLPVGGSPAEAWMSEQALQPYPHYVAQLQPLKNPEYVQALQTRDKNNSDQWFAALSAADIGQRQHWATAELSHDGWQPLQVPGFWREQDSDFALGAAWVRNTIELSAAQAEKKATLWLGAIVDGDQVYVNGQLVGSTGYQYPPRIYSLPEGLLRAGANDIRIRVTSYSNNPGFVKDKRYGLALSSVASGDEWLSLEGQWRYRVGATMPSMAASTTLHYQPASLFNGKIGPLLPLAFKGVIWYQGESNVGRTDASGATEYTTLFPDLIRDWRAQFKREDLPFLFVQLANFLPATSTPGESAWAELRQAQRAALSLPHTAMAVAIDTGEWNDIHPQDKKTVGERLALAALAGVYGHKLAASGPVLARVTRKNDSLVLHFSQVEKGLRLRDERGGWKAKQLTHIAIAGADKQFVWAQAQVKKDRIVLRAPGVSEPHWVRYAWADNPAGANLYNSAGLPASPFEASVE